MLLTLSIHYVAKHVSIIRMYPQWYMERNENVSNDKLLSLAAFLRSLATPNDRQTYQLFIFSIDKCSYVDVRRSM